MRRLLIFLTAVGIVHSSCPTGFELVRDGQCRGLYATEIASTYNAISVIISKCREINAQPITIHNDEQQTFWHQIYHNPSDLTIIGLVCNTNTQMWEWADGSPVDYKPPLGTQNADLDGPCMSGCTWFVDTSGAWVKYCDSDTRDRAIFCTTQLQQPTGDGCESFEDDSEDGMCYQVSANAQNWEDAQKTCANLDSKVASIHNLQENKFVRQLAFSHGAANGLFLGATSSGKGNEYGWTDGTPMDYKNFYPGFPIPGHGDCLAMDTLSNSGEWMNMDCNSKLGVACAKNAEPRYECTAGPWYENQIIYSPGYPYDASEPCDYFISVAAGKKVRVEVLLLEANTCCDRLILVDDVLGGNVVANLTGEITDQFYTTKSSNLMRVSWAPNGGVNVRGMAFTFKAV